MLTENKLRLACTRTSHSYLQPLGYESGTYTPLATLSAKVKLIGKTISELESLQEQNNASSANFKTLLISYF